MIKRIWLWLTQRWPGDPVTDAEMNARSLADLADKRAPINWREFDAELDGES